MMNQVPNLQLLEGVVNQVKLDTPYDKWIGPLREKKADWEQYCQQHSIPPLDSYALKQFSIFLEKRLAILKTRLREALGAA
jgi:hypothetical protein